jgi:hypothetical protein
MYNYWLGGKDNFAADRALADKVVQAVPSTRQMTWENRHFVTRAAAFMASQGVDQFLDIGTGIPVTPNLHETVQATVPTARVVYVDNDPIVLVHARALMASSPDGALAYVDSDLRHPERLLDDPQLRRVLDLRRPVGLTLVAVLMLLSDADDPWRLVSVLRDAVPSGSYLALTHPSGDFDAAAMDRVRAVATGAAATFQPRSRHQVARFFGDWQPVEPGLVPVKTWRPDHEVNDPESAYYWAGVARKP